ncbi:MAG: UvrD-helicase domain-containing protein [Acidimicrobiales bacterium]
MTLHLSDVDVRELICTDLATRLAVAAGAGSGKTTALVGRIVSLVVNSRVDLSTIAAITFTEAAASKLRSEVRTALTNADKGAAAKIEDATICTIHAFALRVLSEHWAAAGLPPDIEVLDAAGEHLEHEREWRALAGMLFENADARAAITSGFALGLRLKHLSAAARTMSENYDRLTGVVMVALGEECHRYPAPNIELSQLIKLTDEARQRLSSCKIDDDPLAVHISRTLSSACSRLRSVAGADNRTVLSVLEGIGDLSASNKGRKQNWPDVDDVRGACAAAEKVRNDLITKVRHWVVADLTLRLADWALKSAERRQEAGRLTFHDLLAVTCRLLREDKSTRDALRARYRCVLIDEFQDTDPLQAQIATLICQEDEDDARANEARLFIVGDPAQSIYRFRGADVAMFEQTANAMDRRCVLTTNFRSAPEILDFVEQIFRAPGLHGGASEGTGHRMTPARVGGGATGGPEVAVFGARREDSKSRDVRARSTEELASVLAHVVSQRWQVEDDGTWRDVRFGDIAVLLPSRTTLPALERALEDAQIPYRLEGAGLIWASQDVRDVLAIARAAIDPSDAIAVVAALRTSVLACGDDDLFTFASSGGRFDPRSVRAASGGSQGPVVPALGLLAELNELATWTDASGLISQIVSKMGFFEVALVHARPRDHWQRLSWIIDQARAFDDSMLGTPGDFLAWAELSEQLQARTASLGPPESDDDAVRVMTIHGSKGLEFPVVVVSGLDSQPSNVAEPVRFTSQGLPQVRFRAGFESPGYSKINDAERALDSAERNRLLYVALTRARDHLVVDLNHTSTDHKSLASVLYPLCKGVKRLTIASVVSDPPSPRPTVLPKDEEWWAEHRMRVKEIEASVSSGRRPAWSATGLASSAARRGWKPALDRFGRGDHVDRDAQRGVGLAVHNALAAIELPTDGWLSAEALVKARTSAAGQHLDPEQTEHVLRLVASAVGSRTVRAIASRRHWKELPLAVPAGEDGVLEGFADLVGEADGSVTILDFKTATRSRSREHLLQVALYAHALRATTGVGVACAGVVYLAEQGTSEVLLSGSGLETTIDQALEALQAQAEPANSLR